MTEKLDVELLKKDIDELCDIMDVKPCKNDIQIERKGENVASFLKEWTVYNNNYLKSTINTGV
ncbi:MAG: hypothetical protein PHV42_04300 [Candidatus Pacebacteria bacterium]|nr:hypothetical protein [Candidatus Paceibacterota bacterium]